MNNIAIGYGASILNNYGIAIGGLNKLTVFQNKMKKLGWSEIVIKAYWYSLIEPDKKRFGLLWSGRRGSK